jgi:hypothetical protein
MCKFRQFGFKCLTRTNCLLLAKIGQPMLFINCDKNKLLYFRFVGRIVPYIEKRKLSVYVC